MPEMFVPVSAPHMEEEEKAFVRQALEENAISGLFGSALERFESEFAAFCGSKYAVTCSNGTTAIHLALAAAGIGEGDEVLVSTLTNMASFFAVLYLGATPVPVDIDRATLTMDVADLERKITPRSKAIMVVHLFGQATEMNGVNALAKAHDLLVFEDCAEAHGATYYGDVVGSLGTAGCFSFFANKIITTGEGGMVTTNDPDLAAKAKSLKALAFGTTNKFMHQDIGYNYRMTNVQAAIGCGQMMKADRLIEKRREIARFYSEHLARFAEHIDLPIHRPHAKNVIWMYHMVLKGALKGKRGQIMAALKDEGVETREGFIPYNLQDIFLERGLTTRHSCPVANDVAYDAFYLPTGPGMTEDQLGYVAAKYTGILEKLV
jgi:perosamine synthetase